MCGIAGIVAFDPRASVDAERLIRMRDVLRHRGPDDAGLWIDGPVGLAHRRLSIVDVAGGRQPMRHPGRRLWIVYNGEIYNHPELMQELKGRGAAYRTRSDTETILHLYAALGDDCVQRLRGMFAFVLWDAERQRLLMARDRLGIKPLYYAWTDTELLFASEIKGVLAGYEGPRRLNHAVLPEYLATGFYSGPETFFRGVRKLQPGRLLAGAAQRARERRYWQLPPMPSDDDGTDLQTASRRLGERLSSVVRSHLMSDVPVGVFLSGGLDSSGIAAIAKELYPHPMHTFSVAFDTQEANELSYAREVAGALQTQHHEVVVAASEFFRSVPRLLWHEDEPIAFPSSIPLYFVSALAQRYVKVVLSGEGADELFLGYNRYRVTEWNMRLSALLQMLPEAVPRHVRSLLARLPFALQRYLARTALGVPPGARAQVFENFAIFSQARQCQLLRRPWQGDPWAGGLSLYAQPQGDRLLRMSYADLQTYLVELLMKQDQMSMAASVESRVPFLDHELVEHALRMPSRMKLAGWETKAVLRRALAARLPERILERKKMGFPVPLDTWFRGPFRHLVDDWVASERALDRGLLHPDAVRQLVSEQRDEGVSHGHRLWLLANLELWQRIYLDDEAPQAALGELGESGPGLHAARSSV